MKKKQCGGVWGREKGANYIPLSMDIPFPSDSIPFSLTNCLDPPKTDPAAEYRMGVQPGRLGSIKPPPIFLKIKKKNFTKSVIFINIWQS